MNLLNKVRNKKKSIERKYLFFPPEKKTDERYRILQAERGILIWIEKQLKEVKKRNEG